MKDYVSVKEKQATISSRHIDFELHRFVKLPSNVIRDVFSHLPLGFVYEAFRDVPELSEIVKKECFSQVTFQLYPARRRSSLWNVMESYDEVVSFLEQDSDIIPRRVTIIADACSTVVRLLMTFKRYFSRIPELSFQLKILDSDSCPFVQFLNEFPNAKEVSFQFRSMKLPSFSCYLQQLLYVDSISIDHRGVANWSEIIFPDCLKQLHVTQCDISELTIPSNVKEILWTSCSLESLELADVHFPDSLSTLDICDCSITSLNLGDLPRSLESLVMNECGLLNIEDRQGWGWPSSLRSIDLGLNLIDDAALDQIVKGSLPQGLRTLKLDSNAIRQLHLLKPLPNALRLLDVSTNPLLGLEDPTWNSEVEFYEFPEQLETLCISGCRITKESASTNKQIPPKERIQFPTSLANLSLDRIIDFHLEQVLFPKSLRRLSLTGSGITDLSHYEYGNFTQNSGEKTSVSWVDLDNLLVLDLTGNVEISTKTWRPPPNLAQLNIDENTELKRRHRMTSRPGFRAALVLSFCWFFWEASRMAKSLIPTNYG